MMSKLSLILATILLLASAPQALADNGAARPDGATFGIGAGWVLPADIDRPNTVGVRFRLPSGLTFEPRVELSNNQLSQELGGASNDTSTTALVLSTTARFPMQSRGPVDMVLVGGFTFDYLKVNPEGTDNNQTDSVLALVYGLSVNYWIKGRWALSFTAANPVIVRTSSTDEQVGGNDTTTTSTSIGAVFDPTVTLMVHLFY
jgi:hypothetical protein